MRFLGKHRPSPAMVVASISLLVALGGTSVAAVNQLAANSVGTSQLKSNAVTTPKIKNSAINASKLASNAVNAAKIANNAVAGSEIKNASIQPADLSSSAKTAGPPGTPGAPGAPGPAGPSGPSGVATPGYVAQVTSQTSASEATTNSTSFVPLAGSSQTVAVPTGETARIYAVFSAASACSGAGVGNFCSVRITVDGTELNPVVGGGFAFDGTDNGDEGVNSSESHAIARSSDTLAAGNHTVQVEMSTTSGTTTSGSTTGHSSSGERRCRSRPTVSGRATVASPVPTVLGGSVSVPPCTRSN